MELRNVYTFIRAAELKNFSKTAELLGYAQSTVTMQIHQLEEELGKPLFDRLGRTVSLTTFGEACLPLARKLYATAQEMQSLEPGTGGINRHSAHRGRGISVCLGFPSGHFQVSKPISQCSVGSAHGLFFGNL